MRIVLLSLALIIACGGMESSECKDYFAHVQRCIEKATPDRAAELRRQLVSNKRVLEQQKTVTVPTTCRKMLELLVDDLDADDCK